PNREIFISYIEFARPDFYLLNLPNWWTEKMREQAVKSNKQRKSHYSNSRRNIFIRIFWLYNSKPDEENGEQPINMENMTSREKRIVQTKFGEFLSYLYTDVTEFMHPANMRELLSGMLYFRLKILPIFIDLLSEVGQEFIASVEASVRDEMHR
ncbi:hypothetical protein PFISCL1PPCAC_24229, partial [Pristionchus fissidentatus]